MTSLHLHPVGLKAIRTYRDMPLKDAAAMLGMTATSYARLENGTRRMYFNMACQMADTLRCSLDDLRRTWTDDELFARFGPNLTPQPERPAAPPAPPAASDLPPPPPPGLTVTPADPDGTVVAAVEGWEA